MTEEQRLKAIGLRMSVDRDTRETSWHSVSEGTDIRCGRPFGRDVKRCTLELDGHTLSEGYGATHLDATKSSIARYVESLREELARFGPMLAALSEADGTTDAAGITDLTQRAPG